MIDISELRTQLHRVRVTLALCLSYCLVVIAGVTILYFWKDIPFGDLLRDPTAIMGAPAYVGMVSNIGILMWVAAGSIFLFAGSVLYQRVGLNHTVAFLLTFGLFTLVLATDDLLLLHEDVLPHLGIRQKLLLSGYMVTMAVLLVTFRRTILKTDYLVLAAAMLFFSISMAVDVLLPFSDVQTMYEDSAKFIGITLWLAYFVHTGAWAMRTSIRNELMSLRWMHRLPADDIDEPVPSALLQERQLTD